MFKPKVSIVIPVYNGSNYLGEAIESAINQTYDNLEIIVVNDGSDDGGKTRQVAMKYKDKIRYFEKENGGVASALNFGIKKMEGEYFSWLSHDDMYYPTKIEEQIKFLENLDERNIVISSDVEIVDKNGNHIDFINLKYDPDSLIYTIVTNSIINGCTLLIPQKVFNDVGLFDENLMTIQDYDMWIRILKKYDFYHLNKVLVKSRRHNEQDTIKKIDLVIKEKKSFRIKALKEIRNSNRYKLRIYILTYIKVVILNSVGK